MKRRCRHCGHPLATTRGWFCSTVCRKRAYRRRQRGVAEDAYPSGARRGRVDLATETRRELRARLMSVREV
jgi:hypothetical protein